ncbi:hypothetical protein HUT16_28820 [Kitasatospora sp. NA04385]|uniref:hypothetical protein n=1 Tax=Kitasatospora sp. NA04385 TaxID=2742135 RepID=UPI0015903944|nr:hypothetical protein [Kitasatospora sp. NA04385]QKW22553.1 hypothetical protein HUT16_28820 [Kitasatospora sp. NA04385]
MADFASWEREFPLRYVLVREVDDEDDREAVELLGRCADAEGLYLPHEYPDRTVLVLEGCPADSPLAVMAAGPGGRQLGDLELLVLEENGDPSAYDYQLGGVSVVTVRPTAGAPGLVDLVVTADHRDHPYEGRPRYPARPGYAFWSPDRRITEPLGHCRHVGGLLARRPARADPIQLIGCEPAPALLALLTQRGGRNEEWGKLAALDRSGRVMATEEVMLHVTEARPSVLGGPLLDVTLADCGYGYPVLEGRPVRERWFEGPPTEPNQWAQLDTWGRREWLALCRTGPSDSPRSGGTHHLDGRHVTDVPGLHLAIGEAVLGPGLEMGSNLFWLRDRLWGGTAVVSPFTLVWHDAETARRCLAGEIVGGDPVRSYFDVVLEVLAERGVTVVLD